LTIGSKRLGWDFILGFLRRGRTVARLERVDPGSKIIAFGDLSLDPIRFELSRSGELIEIKPKVLDLLVYLIQHRDRLVTKDELLDNFWADTAISEGSLTNLIYELRAAVGDDAQRQVVIETVRGRGFRFVAEVYPFSGETSAESKLQMPTSRPGLSEAILMIVLCAVIPNAILASINYAYNSSQVVVDSIRPAFDTIVFWYNPVSFSLSMALDLLFAWKALGPLRSGFRGTPSVESRQRSLLLGHIIALIGIFTWTLAGILYPLLLELMTGVVTAEGTLHFFASLVLCGLVAAVFPFFSMTEYSVVRIYPGLGGVGQEADRSTLLRLRQLGGAYLLAAGGVPLLSITLLAITGEHERLVLAWVSGFGILMLAAAFGMYRRLAQRIEMHLL
jgi:DNA-binding winged helix-turn-helix (wHTH) protein